MYCEKTLKVYLNDLAARLPAPGGGSACALNAALGASLISMVINFTLGKPKYAAYEKELKGILEKSEKLRQEFLNLVDLDVEAYKSRDIRNALNVPLMLNRLTFEAIKLCLPLIEAGNAYLISDVACAAVLLESASAGAVYNIEINLKELKDKKLTSSVRKELKEREARIKEIRREVEVKVGEIIRG